MLAVRTDSEEYSARRTDAHSPSRQKRSTTGLDCACRVIGRHPPPLSLSWPLAGQGGPTALRRRLDLRTLRWLDLASPRGVAAPVPKALKESSQRRPSSCASEEACSRTYPAPVGASPPRLPLLQ